MTASMSSGNIASHPYTSALSLTGSLNKGTTCSPTG